MKLKDKTQIGVQSVNVEHCSCSPLVKQLIVNQLMPASYQSPKRALDFALLDYFHLFKMNAYVSNHCFARIWNQSFYEVDALEVNINLKSASTPNPIH